MRTGIGVGVIVSAGLLGLLLLARWRMVPERTAPILAPLLGVALGAGVLLLQDDPEVADWVVALGGLAAFTPLHVRMLVGRPGQAA